MLSSALAAASVKLAVLLTAFDGLTRVLVTGEVFSYLACLLVWPEAAVVSAFVSSPRDAAVCIRHG